MDGDEMMDEPQSAEALEAYVARLLADRAPSMPSGLDRDELRAYLLASALAGQRPGAADPPPEVRARLAATLEQALAGRGPLPRSEGARTWRLSRRQSLTAAAGLAAGALVGVAVDRKVIGLGNPSSPGHQELIGTNGRWYDVAAVAAVPEGAVRRFTAGAVDGYLLNEKGRVWALSAICTHMGCHLNWAEAHGRFECLCHSATFDRYGAPRPGLPLAALPHIYVRVTSGRIYVWGTQATSWGW